MPTPSPRKASNYIDVATLAELVRRHRRKRVISHDLARALMTIAGGVWDRFRFTEDRDDFVQEVTLHLLQRPLEKADVQKHVFNYFTTCAIRFGMKLRDKAYGDRRRFETYAAELVEAGRPVVDGVVGRANEASTPEAEMEAAEAEVTAAELVEFLERFHEEVRRDLAADGALPQPNGRG